MRCPRCGNDNPETNRFCGMCGAPLRLDTVLPARPATTQSANVAAPAKAAAGAPAGMESPTISTPAGSEPVITGPSFLGLNRPAPSSGRSANLTGSAHGVHSRNLDYLLEDNEEPRRGSGKWLLIFFALLLCLGFGYLRWKQGGFPWLDTVRPQPAAQPAQPVGQSGTPSPEASQAPSSTPPPSITPEGSPGTASSPVAAGTPAGSPPGSSAPPSSNPSAVQTGDNSSPANAAASPANSTPDAGPKPTKPESAASATDSPAPTPDEAAPVRLAPAPAKPKAAAKPTAAKPALAKPTPSKSATDAVTQAEKYLYGRGVPQDCDRGLRILKPVANEANPIAMASLGALYATGLCTPRDLPTAYRWFAKALQKEPDNEALQENIQKLWSQMTQPERQLAIKLSQ